MFRATVLLIVACAVASAQGQKGPPPGWPCVAGRAVDPAYTDISESTGGQLFLFQKGEIAQSTPVMMASQTHPATVLRAVGNFSGARDFEFPVEAGVESILVLASLQCRKAVGIYGPNGVEMTAANSAMNADLQAGRIVRIDSPAPGKWAVRLEGTGLYVLSVLSKASIGLPVVAYYEAPEGLKTLREPLLGTRQVLETRVSGNVSDVRVELIDAGGSSIAAAAAKSEEDGVYRVEITPSTERFRVRVTGTDRASRPFQRTYPVLFRAQRPN